MPLQTHNSGGTLPPWLSAALESVAQIAQGRYNSRTSQPYQPYSGERVAPFNSQHATAKALASQTGAYGPALNAANEQAVTASKTFPENYASYMSPYQQAVIDRIRTEGMRTFNENILPALSGQFTSLGQHGGSRHQQMAERAAREIQNEILAKQAQALQEGYGQAGQLFNYDQARRIESAKVHALLGQAIQSGKLSDIEQLNTQAELEREREQNILNAKYREYLEGKAFPDEALNQYISILQGTPYEPSRWSSTDIPTSSSLHSKDWGRGIPDVYKGIRTLFKKRGGHLVPTKVAPFKKSPVTYPKAKSIYPKLKPFPRKKG